VAAVIRAAAPNAAVVSSADLSIFLSL